MPGWLLALLIALGLYVVLRRLFHRPDPAEAWRLLAEATGLRFDPGAGAAAGPSLRGRYRDVDVRLAVEAQRGSGAPNTVIQAAIPLPGTTGVWGAATHRLVDGQDPWTRPGRDHLALARQSNSPSVAAALERPEVRDLADAFLSHHSGARIADDWITLTIPGRITDVGRLKALLDEVASTALAFRKDASLAGALGAPGWAAGSEDGRGAGGSHEVGAHQARASAETSAGVPAGAPRGAPNPYAPPDSDLLAPPAPAAEPLDPAVVSAWKRRTAVAYFLGLLPAGIGLCLAVVGGLLVHTSLYGLPGTAWIAIGGGAFGLGLIVFGRAYRCPSCARFLRSPRTGNIVFDPAHCPHCGATLRS